MIRNEVFDMNGASVEAEVIDLDAGTYAREVKGVEVERRALTADEVTLYTPVIPEPTPEEKLDAARAVLDQIQALPAPVLTADVVDMLDDLRGVL